MNLWRRFLRIAAVVGCGNSSEMWLVFLVVLGLVCSSQPAAARPDSAEELLVRDSEIGRYGGHLVVSLRSEPKTLNPVTALDVSSREVIAQMTGDLIHINRFSQRTEPALAKTWSISPDGLRYTLRLRQGLRFSDGHSVSADDVVFSFKVYLDEAIHSSQRDLLTVGGKPISVRQTGDDTVVFELAKPDAAAERLFDSVAILPKHLLEKVYADHRLAESWTLATPPSEIAVLGPFRLKEYLAGQHITLERNPYYWQADSKGHRLPYLQEITFLFGASADAEVIRFQAGETDVINRLSAEDYAVLEQSPAAPSLQLSDLGASLEYNFLLLNMNAVLPKSAIEVSRKRAWFQQLQFRQALSLAIDRDSIARLVYRGRATPLWAPATPGSKYWVNAAIPHPARSVGEARQLLHSAGFSWKTDGTLLDTVGSPVEFSIMVSASNAQRTQMATLIQADLKELGIRVQVVPMDFRALLDRVFQSHDYETAILALGGGDVDPTSNMNVWLSSGTDHLWNLGQVHPATSWEAEIDQLMEKQLSALNLDERKRAYDRVQEILAQNVPLICLASPNTLVAAKRKLGNFKPAILEPHTLWNSQELFFTDSRP